MFNKRPLSFKSLDHAKDANELLQNLSKNPDMPHLLIHGPEGSGKYTRALLYLQNIFGKDVYNVEPSTVTIDVKGKPQEVNIRSSPYHVELVLSDAGDSDKAIVQEYIKSLSTVRTLTNIMKAPAVLPFAPKTPAKAKPDQKKEKPAQYRVIMLFDADHLSNDAQQSLRRTMEVGSDICRFILFSTNPCSIIQPIRSRCVMVRVPSPSPNEMCSIVSKLGGNEKIVQYSRGNILSAEGAAFEYRLTGVIERPYWMEKLAGVAMSLPNTKPREFEKTKDQVIELLTVISPETVMRSLFSFLMESKIPNTVKEKIPQIAVDHSRGMMLGSEPIYHVEAFLLDIVSLFNK